MAFDAELCPWQLTQIFFFFRFFFKLFFKFFSNFFFKFFLQFFFLIFQKNGNWSRGIWHVSAFALHLRQIEIGEIWRKYIFSDDAVNFDAGELWRSEFWHRWILTHFSFVHVIWRRLSWVKINAIFYVSIDAEYFSLHYYTLEIFSEVTLVFLQKWQDFLL